MKASATSAWRETTFGELVEFQDHKRVPLSSRERASRRGQYPYYGASGIIDNVDSYIFDGPHLLISEDGENLNSRKTPIAFRASGKFWVNNHAHIVRGKPNVAHDQYLEYLIAVTDISGLVTGAAQPKLSQANLKIMKMRVPDFLTQTAILKVLSPYDDMIENNTRRIKILEEMAQRIYREWFVNFRFPGHEKVRMVESELGPNPKGWDVERLEDVVEEFIDYRGKTPTKLGGDWSNAGILALSALNVKQGRLVNLDKARFVSEELYKRWMKSELQAGDVLMTSEAPLGEVYFLPEARRYCLSQRVFAIRSNPERILPSLLFFFLSSPEGRERLNARASGTTVLGIRQADLRQIPIIRPPLDAQHQGDATLRPILNLIDATQRKISNLLATRDLLLPKLISGEISVEAAEETALAAQPA